MKRKPRSPFITSDPKVCHGRLTFRGTRILVGDVLELVAAGTPWDKIVEEFHGSISGAAIAAAIRFANQTIAEHVERPASA